MAVSTLKSRPRFRKSTGETSADFALNGLVRVFAVLTPLVTVPVVARTLGATEYGAYLTISAIAGMLGLFEGGVTLGLVTALASVPADPHGLLRRKRLVSAATVWTTFAGVAILTLMVSSTFLFDWQRALGLSSSRTLTRSTISLALVVVTGIFAVSLPTGLATKAMLGLGETKLQALWLMTTYPLMLGATFAVALLRPTLLGFLIAVNGPPVLTGIAATVWYFLRKHAELRPRLALATRHDGMRLLGYGVPFSVGAVGAAISYQTDSLVLAHIQGVASVAVYGVAYRVGSTASLIVQGALLPLWPLLANAIATRRFPDAARALRLSMRASVAAGIVFSVGFVFLGRLVVTTWTGSGYTPPEMLIWGVAAWGLLQVAQLPLGLFLVSADKRVFISITTMTMAILNLPLSIIFTRIIGVSGPVWATAVTNLLCVAIPSAVVVRSFLRLGTNPEMAGNSSERKEDAG